MNKDLYIFNSLTSKKELFKSIIPNQVSLYVCGPTVYSSSHMGHARSAIVFDSIVRFLKYIGLKTKYVRNFTDIDDKIIARANEEGRKPEEISEKYKLEYIQDMKSLGCNDPDHQPSVSENIPEIINLIKDIIEKKFGYESNGDVYFNVQKFKEYGKLSNQSIDSILSNTRLEINPNKNYELDFALWKEAKPNEPYWESPWGNGRPGWHIECSAMSRKYLGENFDIHGGGRDLIFPHHENEIAQSECISGKKFANYWIHNGLININKEKMSKSIGNIVNIKEGLKVWDKNIFRILFLTHHYRTPVDLSNKKLAEVGKSLLNLKKKLEINESSSSNFKELWVSAMLDDFNTAKALGYYFKFINDGKLSNKSTVELEEFEETMGISGWRNNISNPTDKNPINKEEIEELIIERNKARSEKDWVKADKLRERAEELGIKLLDNDEGTIWE
ncbi:cysteine--tRNA ligase [bacterium]|nr:cysteine--tRNA ligase [bacterium]